MKERITLLKEAQDIQQKARSQSLLLAVGVWCNSGVSRQGRGVTFDVQQIVCLGFPVFRLEHEEFRLELRRLEGGLGRLGGLLKQALASARTGTVSTKCCKDWTPATGNAGSREPSLLGDHF